MSNSRWIIGPVPLYHFSGINKCTGDTASCQPPSEIRPRKNRSWRTTIFSNANWRSHAEFGLVCKVCVGNECVGESPSNSICTSRQKATESDGTNHACQHSDHRWTVACSKEACAQVHVGKTHPLLGVENIRAQSAQFVDIFCPEACWFFGCNKKRRFYMLLQVIKLNRVQHEVVSCQMKKPLFFFPNVFLSLADANPTQQNSGRGTQYLTLCLTWCI